MTNIRDRIDTLEGLKQTLGGTDWGRLHEVAAERRRWVKEHPGEHLGCWYVFGGRIVLDEQGQVWSAEIEPDLAWVQSADVNEIKVRATWSSKGVPRPIDRCLHCQQEIRVQDVGRAFVGNYDAETDRLSIYHEECRIFALDTENRQRFTSCFDEAFREMVAPKLKPIPNGYGFIEYGGPWYQLDSTMLGNLTFGWRKRVIHLDWAESKKLLHVDGQKVFAGEDVTCGERMVHAWGYEKFTAYLKMLFEAIGKP